MRFVDYQKGGEPDSLFIAQAEAPALTAGKVRVRVRGFGI
ncbi:MAG TPA: zinc-binding alcohol dehydrogenase, partial [Alteromonas australica]|nr:zinc-binding alcohol dehydrogenase [Alteromonas australica]